MRRICFVAAIEPTIKAFMVAHMLRLQQNHEITVIVCTVDTNFLKPYGIKARVIPVNITREISCKDDVRALIQLVGIFLSNQFDAVHSITPKAGLLAMTAAFVARIPVRIHCFTGQVWANRRGFMRYLLKFMDLITAACATRLLTDSNSQQKFLIRERIVISDKISVLANGSVVGVDLKRFVPNPEARHNVRKRLDIPEESLLFLYIGRLNKDKGVLDLASAFSRLRNINDNVFLLIVGSDEGGMKERMCAIMGPAEDSSRFVDHTESPEEFMAAADLTCLPSYREGFGLVVVEAAAAGVPALASRIYGITDAVVDGATGLLHEPGNVGDIFDKMRELTENRELLESLGKMARERVLTDFSQEKVVAAMSDFYENLWHSHIS